MFVNVNGARYRKENIIIRVFNVVVKTGDEFDQICILKQTIKHVKGTNGEEKRKVLVIQIKQKSEKNQRKENIRKKKMTRDEKWGFLLNILEH